MKRKVSGSGDHDLPDPMMQHASTVNDTRPSEWDRDRRQLLESLEQKNSDYMMLRLELEKLQGEFQRMRSQREKDNELGKKSTTEQLVQLQQRYDALEKQKIALEQDISLLSEERALFHVRNYQRHIVY